MTDSHRSVDHSRDLLRIEAESPTSDVGSAILRAYMSDISGRYLGRPPTGAEIDAVLRDAPSDDLVAPGGILLVARQGRYAVGCAGLLLLPDRLGEVRRVFVDPRARGRGIGTGLMTELERLALDHGVTRLRLDVRHDLVEARALYAALGYEEVPAFNDARYAAHWFAKSLT